MLSNLKYIFSKKTLFETMPALKFSFSILFITLVISFVLKQSTGISNYELMADPAEVAKVSPFIGFWSQIGLFQWAAAAGLCFFTSLLWKRNGSESKQWASFLLCAGWLNILLLFDDAFQLHENFYRLFYYGNSPIPVLLEHSFELAFFLLYAFLLGLLVRRFRKLYQKTNYQVILLSIVFFVLSVVVDFIDFNGNLLGLIEDCFKLLGISTWLVYLADCCHIYIQQSQQ